MHQTFHISGNAELHWWICIRLSLNCSSTCVKWIPPETDSDGYNLSLTQDDLTSAVLWVGVTDALIWETRRRRGKLVRILREDQKNGRKVGEDWGKLGWWGKKERVRVIVVAKKKNRTPWDWEKKRKKMTDIEGKMQPVHSDVSFLFGS